ncbi:MAG TPA: hypothetical protein VJ436_02510 [Anaerolineales bacterium]|nr:hypothetical protein [Anaerolineales bacterium]
MVDRFIVVDTVSGRTEAEFLISFLQARGIKCELSQEAVGWVYGMGVGPLAEVDILVPSNQGKQAREALKEYHKTKHKSTEKIHIAKRTKARHYLRYPLSSVLIYNGSTVLHFLLGGIGIILGYRFSPWVGYSLGILYLVFSFIEMYAIMPLKVCPNCVYYQARDSRCISGLNILSRKIAKEGNLKDFPRRAEGLFCPNNLYMAALIVPVLAMAPALIVNFSAVLLLIFLAVTGLLLFRFFVLFPKIACLHCCAKYRCPQAGAMGVRNL